MRFVRAYDYVDESGVLLFQVVRWEPKTFSQRHPDGRGGWKRVSNGKLTMAGCRMVPYRLDLLAAAATKLAEHGVVPLAYVCEGEKDSDRLLRGGCLATTAPGGAGKWNPEFARYFENFECVLLPDPTTTSGGGIWPRSLGRFCRSRLGSKLFSCRSRTKAGTFRTGPMRAARA